MQWTKVCASVAAIALGNISVAEARAVSSACASAAEISAIQVAAVQQELTDAALACGPNEVALFNRFQKTFSMELRRSDATMMRMFKRLNGNAGGNAAYDSFKTRAIAHAEQRRTKPGAHANFCKTADVVFAAALAPDKPVLEDFVSGVPVNEANPVDSCEIKVAVSLQGVQAGPDIVPTPRPDLPGDGQNIPAVSR
ncbi:MAG TPA: hypothetical protein VFI23_05735 [Rhizomicrobium sp.]|nr:hypothetical protein [Rhizomicrobium sp.]